MNSDQIRYPSSRSSSRRGRPVVFPPPPQAILSPVITHTENSSGTSSSGSKRKRTVKDDGSDRGPATRASSASDFTSNTKTQLREQSKNKCWHCGASPADICHVIGSRDNTFRDALQDGLIDFQEKQNPQNAIALCGTCHTNFDHTYNPSFFFLPTDLDYFLSYEKQDQKRRRKLGRRTGMVPKRICPTAQTYQDHQIRQGLPAESGGLYTRIIVKDFLPDYPGRAPFRPGPSEYGAEKAWKGSPMASLQRAVLMLRRLNLRGVPMDVRDSLRQLQDAYSEEVNVDGSDTSSQCSTDSSGLDGGADGIMSLGGETVHDVQSTHEEQGERDLGADDLSKNIATPSGNGDAQDSGTYPDHTPIRSWHWGPLTTSNDAAKFFRGVFALSMARSRH